VTTESQVRVKGLSHFGMFVRDLDTMTEFYRDFLGMRVTKCAPGRGVLLCADMEREDHEIALIAGRPPQEHPKLIQQISFRVDSLDEVRAFYHRIKAAGYRIQRTVSHASAIGCYFYDPEGNVVEVCCWSGHESWALVGEAVDLDQSNEAIMVQVDDHWNRVKHIPMGGPTTPDLMKEILQLRAEGS
jgi:catechol 2,3-dioxygenase-like lactoylglutathione lyase family enzyme